jgi:spoIIIJ-associated protein
MESQAAKAPDPKEAGTGTSRQLEAYLPRIESLLRQVIQHGGFELAFAIRKNQPMQEELEAPEYQVEFSGRDADLLLEKGATLLNALEYVVLKGVRLEEELFGKITFDCQDWRRLRARELQLTAQVAAERVIQTGDPFPLSPMTSRERRIIHMALKDLPLVRTVSEGKGPERKVVILPASPPKPAV